MHLRGQEAASINGYFSEAPTEFELARRDPHVRVQGAERVEHRQQPKGNHSGQDFAPGPSLPASSQNHFPSICMKRSSFTIVASLTLAQCILPHSGFSEAATAADSAQKNPSPAQSKLPGETITVDEAKALVRKHTQDKGQLEAQRQAALAAAVNLKGEARVAYLTRFLETTAGQRKQLQDDAPRVSNLEAKVRTAEKSSSSK